MFLMLEKLALFYDCEVLSFWSPYVECEESRNTLLHLAAELELVALEHMFPSLLSQHNKYHFPEP